MLQYDSNLILEGGIFMELKFICKCTCGEELEEKDISVFFYEEECEMDFVGKCPKCGKKESMHLPQEVKRRIIDREEKR